MRLYFRTIFALLVFILLILSFVSAIWPRLQMLVFAGEVPIPSIALKVGIATLLIIGSVTSINAYIPKAFAISWLILSAYLLLDFFHITSETNNISFSIFSYNAYYAYLIFSVYMFNIASSLKQETIFRFIMWLALPLALMGIAQYILSDPILPTASKDQNFAVSSWEFYGNVRAYSFFTAPFEFGYFMLFIFSSSIVLFAKNKKRRFWVMLQILVVLFAAYCTLTRLVYIEAIFVAIFTFLFLILKGSFRQILRFIPIIFLAIALYVAFWLPSLITKSSSDLTSYATLNQRLEQWATYWYYLWESNNSLFFFGTGLIQNERFGLSQNVLIDSIYVAIAVHIGIVGLLFILIFMMQAWTYMLHQTMKFPSAMNVGILALWSTYLASGVFNLTIPLSGLLLLIFILVNRYSSPVIGRRIAVNSSQSVVQFGEALENR